jgi:adenylosuccinate synthase
MEDCRRAVAVIGANYGDEGKGQTVHDLVEEAAKKKVQVSIVKHNGGAQAGHTVVRNTDDFDKRAVFSQFGAHIIDDYTYTSDLVSPYTYLSRDFVFNPIALQRELDLNEEFLDPLVMESFFVHPECRIATSFDMLSNQFFERDRGVHRHGSCGHGVHETIVRNELGVKLDFATAKSMLSRKRALQRIIDYHAARIHDTIGAGAGLN